ncbi:MAG: NAD(P)H-dependent oxidoreductase [Rhodospirillales bacterium]|nr:NAD(P)H-dependent oxidoreductase [Rhodospirillales bacterium]
MTDKPTLLILAGSARKDSFNKKLARHAAAIAEQQGATIRFIDLKDYPMPIYDGDFEDERGLPDSAKDLKKLFAESDGFLIAAPEYNSSLAPLLKNALDWISRKETDDEPPLIAFKGKVAALVAASPGGYGGLRGLVPLRMMLGNIGVTVIPDQLAVPQAHEAFDENDRLKNPGQVKALEHVMTTFINTTGRLAK